MELIGSMAFWAAPPLTALAALGCGLYGRGRRRTCLLWTGGLLALSLLVLAGGGWVLGLLGLAWRSLPETVLAWAALGGWLGVCLFTPGCLLPLELPGWRAGLRWAVKGAVLLCAGLSLWTALTLGTLLLSFSGPGLEREVEYRGVTLVEVDRGFLDPDYRYYSCRGPLLRGSRPLYCTGKKLLAGLQ